jgi:hypothetical protein
MKLLKGRFGLQKRSKQSPDPEVSIGTELNVEDQFDIFVPVVPTRQTASNWKILIEQSRDDQPVIDDVSSITTDECRHHDRVVQERQPTTSYCCYSVVSGGADGVTEDTDNTLLHSSGGVQAPAVVAAATAAPNWNCCGREAASTICTSNGAVKRDSPSQILNRNTSLFDTLSDEEEAPEMSPPPIKRFGKSIRRAVSMPWTKRKQQQVITAIKAVE